MVRADTDYPEGFDATCGISAHAMRTANMLMCSLLGKRDWDVPMLASALESFQAVAAAAEHERCAKIAESFATCPCNGDRGRCTENDVPNAIAAAIRKAPTPSPVHQGEVK
jgi:hypothetical protein